MPTFKTLMFEPGTPRVRPAGSPAAIKFGATDSAGRPLDELARRVQKVMGDGQPKRGERAPGSPLAAVHGATDADGKGKTYAALRDHYAGAVPVRKAAAKKPVGVAVFDAKGKLLGYVDAQKLQQLSTGDQLLSPGDQAVADRVVATVKKALKRPRQPSAITLLTVLGSMSSARVRKAQGARDPLTAGILKFAQMTPSERAKFTSRLANTTARSRAVLEMHLSDQLLRRKD